MTSNGKISVLGENSFQLFGRQLNTSLLSDALLKTLENKWPEFEEDLSTVHDTLHHDKPLQLSINNVGH